MSLFTIFRVALKALTRNKMRTGLTMLGMIIGVAAVITLIALGNGAQNQIEQQIASAGTNMVMVRAGNFSRGGVHGGMGSSTTLTGEGRRRHSETGPQRAIHRGGRQHPRTGRGQ